IQSSSCRWGQPGRGGSWGRRRVTDPAPGQPYEGGTAMQNTADDSGEVKGGWSEGLTPSEEIRHEVIVYANIQDVDLMGLAQEAYDNARVSLQELAALPRAEWDTDHAREQEMEFLGWCMALGKTVLAIWGRGLSWQAADEPEVVGEDDAA